jgi:excisionase family DNA binding protein
MMSSIYLDIKELSQYLKIKPSTLYAWASQGKIPHVKINNSLIRFEKEKIDAWVASFQKEKSEKPVSHPAAPKKTPVDIVIDRVKREVYNNHRGETTPISSPKKGG